MRRRAAGQRRLPLDPIDIPDAPELQQAQRVVDGVDAGVREISVREEWRHLRSLRHVDSQREGRERGKDNQARPDDEGGQRDRRAEPVAELHGGMLVAEDEGTGHAGVVVALQRREAPALDLEKEFEASLARGPRSAFAWTSRRPAYGVQRTNVILSGARVGARGGPVSQVGMPRQSLQAASHSGTRPFPWWEPCQTEDASDCAEGEPSAPPDYLFGTTLGAYSWS